MFLYIFVRIHRDEDNKTEPKQIITDNLMILYNITINIESAKEVEFIAWMKQEYLPRVMQTGLFFEKRFFRLIQEDNGDGINFSAQFLAESMEDLEFYQIKYASILRDLIKDKFGNQFVSFRSVLESVE